MDEIRDEKMKKILLEMTEHFRQIYGVQLKAVILYGSVARGTNTSDSDVDIMVLIDGDAGELRKYEDKLSDVSTDMALKYLKVFSVIDVSYQEFTDWKKISPFYKNVSEEGIMVYTA